MKQRQRSADALSHEQKPPRISASTAHLRKEIRPFTPPSHAAIK